jgi:hypothetical protein
LKKYKSPCRDQIPVGLIQAGGNTLPLEIHKLLNSIWNKEELSILWKESIIAPIHKKGDTANCNNYCGLSLVSTSYNIFIKYPSLNDKFIHRSNYWGSSVWFPT